VLVLVCLSLVVVVIVRWRHKPSALLQVLVAPPVAPPPVRAACPRVLQPVPQAVPQPPSPLTLADAAFEYGRAVLALDDVSETTKDRALGALDRVIIPLVGGLRYAELTPELEAGVARVLLAEADDRAPIHVWNDFVRWTRVHVGARRG
jgi:hypothetical protein